MSSLRRLFYWVQGDDPARRFPVNIASTDTVGDLREMIKKKKEPEFDDVPADSLELWMVRARYFHDNYC
jgi:hypothetical protein